MDKFRKVRSSPSKRNESSMKDEASRTKSKSPSKPNFEKIVKGNEVTEKGSAVVEKESEVDGFIDSKIGSRNESLDEETGIMQEIRKDRRTKCASDDKRISKITQKSNSRVSIVQKINTGDMEGLKLAVQKMERDDKVFDSSEQCRDDASVFDTKEENSGSEDIGNINDVKFKKDKTSRACKRKYEGESTNALKKTKNVCEDDEIICEMKESSKLPSDSRMVLRSPQKEAPNQRSRRKRKGPIKYKNSGNFKSETIIMKEKVSFKEQMVSENFSPQKRLLEKVSKDNVLSPLGSDFEATESESDNSHQEDFPTEDLLEELHFLNASCEKPSFSKTQSSQSYKTPKKLRKLEIRGSEACRSSTPVDKSKKLNLVKKFKDECDQWSSKKVDEVGSIVSESTLQARSEDEYTEDSDEGSLQIVADEENPKKRKSCQGKQRRKIQSLDPEGVPQEVIELIQSGIDEALEEKAERTHLTAIHVKNIIKNVMTDENVVEMVRNTVLGMNTPGTVSSAVYEPTLTRAKTKEIIQQQAEGSGHRSIWAELSKTTTTASTSLNPETRALVTTDFPEEDEDEEYTPENDEQINSDDESLISTNMCSTIGSPTTPYTPTTPLSTCTPSTQVSISTPCTLSDADSPVQPLDKRIQELKPKSAQRVLNFEIPSKEELVSQRTRSKLPLTETPLECLEMAFKPPDVTNDMYETEVLDDDWKTFLIDFIHPLENTEVAEDEDADPEYNILEDKEDASDLREEMRGDRAVQISKKEINDLLTELLATLDSDEEGAEPVRKHLSQHINSGLLQKKKPHQLKNSESQKDSGAKQEKGPPENVIWVEVMTAKFTPYQLDILRQQMTQHVQLLATTVLLCDELPDKSVADSAILLLEELKNSGSISEHRNSFFHPFNLDAALETIQRFKTKNSDIIQPSKMKNPGEAPKQEAKKNNVELTPRVIDAILHSTAFPYPNILPKRMFSESTKYKTIFVPGEDMLVVMALLNHLSSKSEQGTVIRIPPRLQRVLKECLKDRILHKTASQVQSRIKNVRQKLKEHVANKNPLAMFLESGKVVTPAAALEPCIPGIPCPVKDIPEKLLPDPWQKILISRGQVDSQHLELDKQIMRNQLLFSGFQSLNKTGTNMVIIQPGSNAKVMLPSTRAPIVTRPSFGYSVPKMAVLSPITTIKALPVQCPFTEPSLAKAVASKPLSEMLLPPSNSAPPLLQPRQMTADVSGDAREISVDSKLKVLEQSGMQESSVISDKPDFDKTVSTFSPMENSITESTDLEGTTVKSSCNVISHTSNNVSKENESKKDFISSVADNHMSEDSNKVNAGLSKNIDPEKNPNYSLETPHKSPCPSLTEIPTPNLHMPSLLSTPEKLIPSPVKDIRPFISVKYPLYLENEGKQSSTSDVTESEGSACRPLENPAERDGKENSPMRSMVTTENTINAKLDTSPEKNGEHVPILNIQGPLHAASATLVTSVYQSPIPSSGVSGMENIRLIMNMSPQKTAYSSFRKISPAKIMRSPIKTSPMKKVSPILRKYGYRSKIRPSSNKLSPILPKLTPQKPQRIRSPAQRRLTPKAPKEESSKAESQNYSTETSNTTSQLPQVEDELPLVNDASSVSSHLRSTVPQLEEEFEEDDLEEEEEEEEEEDLEAAQQREEHLAALLKASSTIVGKKGDKLGGDIGPAERRLNKQQRRLQARLTALSIVQDTLSKDLSMAQSYLMRVREALTGRDPTLYKKFLCILNEFTENTNESPVQLYGHLCDLLKDFPQLKYEFVSFLLPQQAIAIGKYAQYCTIHRMKDFLDKLKLQYREEPQHIQKIVKALQSLQNSSESDLEKVKASICPLLRYPHLIESFTQCFPSQPPPPSLPSDFEDITLEKSHTPDSIENLTLPDDNPVISPDHCCCPCHVPATGSSLGTTRNDHCQSCAIRFSEGRVYLQYGKTLRPAKVTYHSLNGDSKDSVDTGDACEVTGKSRGTVSKKTSQAKDPGESSLMKNKENMNLLNVENSTSSCADHKGSPNVGEKLTKDELPNLVGKQKESVTGRGSQLKKSLSSKCDEKGDNVDDYVICDSQQTSSTSSVSTRLRGTGNLDSDISLKTRRKPTVINSPPKDMLENELFQSLNAKNKSSSVIPSVSQTSHGEVSRSDACQDSSVLGKKSKETTCVTSLGHKKDIPNVTPKIAEDLAYNDASNVSTRNKKITEDRLEKCSSGEKSDALSALPVLDGSSWTQEENRIMLMVLQKKGSAELAVQEVIKLMPNRTYGEVVEHFNILVRQMMEQSDVEDIVLSSEDDNTRD
ncbi:GON-4-like protein isoform X2 [Palaemon carinicauda]|uniref:GON-4-like protein isoform X2 n=1 Tax=Palaemon carinicauda TaxID=392227 RepID=UPI0035B5EA2E